MQWLAYSILCLVTWGLWGVAIKVAYRELNWVETYFYSSLSSFLLALAIYLLFKTMGNTGLCLRERGLLLASIAGLFGSLGYVFFVKAIERGKASIVIPLTALYPAVTVVVALLLLHEKLNIYNIIGIVLAIIAVILLSVR